MGVKIADDAYIMCYCCLFDDAVVAIVHYNDLKGSIEILRIGKCTDVNAVINVMKYVHGFFEARRLQHNVRDIYVFLSLSSSNFGESEHSHIL